MALVKFYSGSASSLSNKAVEDGSIYVTNMSDGKATMTVDIGSQRYVIKPLVDWNEISNKPTTFAPSSHTHVISDITDLKDATATARGLMSATDKKKLDLLTITQLADENNESVFSITIG